jgi:hypothetical protein
MNESERNMTELPAQGDYGVVSARSFYVGSSSNYAAK